MKRVLLIATLLVLIPGLQRADPTPVERQLESALRKRAALDTLRRYTLTLKSRLGSDLRRRVSILSKSYGDRVYVLGAFFHPRDLRGTAFLGIDRPNGTDRFIYFPAFRIVRRVGAQQKSDSWFGTDLSLEDIEYRPVRDFELLESEAGRLAGEPVRLIDVRPRYGSSYERIRFHVAMADDTILRTEYFSAGRADPSKVVSAEREGMVTSGAMTVPAKVTCRNLESGSWTEVALDAVDFSPEFGREFFSTRTLEMWSKLKSLE